MGAHVLLAEDDPDLRVTTRLVLERQGFTVTVVADGDEAERALAEGSFDVALLDVMMPGRDGIWLTKHIRASLDLPVVLLTARDLVSDEVSGLEAGADDYVTKPFDGDLLVARLRAVLRRAEAGRLRADQVGDLVVDRAGMTLTRSGSEVALSATEFRLLEAFLDHVGIVLSRDQLLERVWGDSDWGDPRVVDVNVQRLRAKIGAEVIVTVRGAGYKMVRP